MSAPPPLGQRSLGPLSRPGDSRLRPVARAAIARERIDQRRLWLFVCTALIAAVAFRSIGQSRTVVAGFGTLRPVAIASNDLLPGKRIELIDLQWEQWPLAIAANYPTESEIEGSVVRSPIPAGAPVHRSQLFLAGATMDADERAVTLPLPLAPPPVVGGDVVDLIGLSPGISIGDRQLIDTRSLGRARVMSVDETGLTVAVDPAQVVAIVETIAIGSVEVVITPFGP